MHFKSIGNKGDAVVLKLFKKVCLAHLLSFLKLLLWHVRMYECMFIPEKINNYSSKMKLYLNGLT